MALDAAKRLRSTATTDFIVLIGTRLWIDDNCVNK